MAGRQAKSQRAGPHIGRRERRLAAEETLAIISSGEYAGLRLRGGGKKHKKKAAAAAAASGHEVGDGCRHSLLELIAAARRQVEAIPADAELAYPVCEAQSAPSTADCVCAPAEAAPSTADCGCDRRVLLQSPSTLVELTGETTLQACLRLAAEAASDADGHPLALNFASAKNPGGGFLGGSLAQEESLAVSSALYATLLEDGPQQHYYRPHRDRHRPNTGVYSHAMVYSPNVPVFRDDCTLRLLPTPVCCHFLTAPAVNAGVALARGVDEATVRQLMAERIRRVLALALIKGHHTLVLGAWGCGVFRNSPPMIAELFRDELNAIPSGAARRLRRVVFAIPNPDGPTARAFADILGNTNLW